MVIAGIDPGFGGAIAAIDHQWSQVKIEDMPLFHVKQKKHIDLQKLVDIIRATDAGHIIIEHVGVMPKQGIVSAFNFGTGFGMLQGIVATIGIPMTLVRPNKWKPKMQVPADKDGARMRASQLLPSSSDLWPLKKHDGRAEAALLAMYGGLLLTR